MTKGGDGGLCGKKSHLSSENMSKDQRKKLTEKIRKKNINTIDPETGLNVYEKAGLKAKDTKINTIDPETGLNVYEKAGKLRQNTRKLWSEEKKKDFSNKMKIISKNSAKYSKRSSKKFLLIAPNGQKIGAYGNIQQICKKYNISWDIIRNHYNNGPIIIKRNASNKAINTEGWEIITINK